MSDIEIVSASYYRNGHMEADSNRVPYGTYFEDDVYQVGDRHNIEELFEGAVPAVDWRGLDTVAEDPVKEPVKRKPGRPKKKVADEG